MNSKKQRGNGERLNVKKGMNNMMHRKYRKGISPSYRLESSRTIWQGYLVLSYPTKYRSEPD